ncbi:UDP-N-acetylmuramoyl-tripeptide--D-alanyl-D-alanine ligase [Pseudoprimorskyibacter insulae]|uniref:UDP-N-acetylmuramoyl-tripeptide--D-alanyl-D-alanine ligase n=1 Tax=Pseudoprimorskyibacter insulae TaxID=1695997 RepID=A0A2R8AQP7_9RHOB|nr:UDP-N-acetylmuramoyl-tripeptide--D-alanyl-D-alanine ligase [Pseudoprimorskyibacter insulae]SPF78382.1 UDP-N-acetylmuramoyl-tripeptide--D-alanyl-D-alanine ligase [Pseudoprimorskyibacter insulae]
MTLWTSKEAVRATGGKITGHFEVTGISIDTRTIQPGDLFVALQAARDGHDFVAQAFEKGAAAALVSRFPTGVKGDAPLLMVQDVLTALEDLGRAARARMTGQVVAVTGSVGKTSTKEMLRTVLGGQGKVHASVASYNNHWGVPLTLARMPEDTEFAVIEIGMNHPGEISPLAQMAQPDVAVVTIVAPAHLAAFESLEGIAREKAAIFDGLKKGGVAIYNGDLPVSPVLRTAAKAKGAKLVPFGESRGTHTRATKITIGDETTQVEARAWRTPLTYTLSAPGRHFAVNALAVLAAAQAFGLDRAQAIADLANWSPVEGRGARQAIAIDGGQLELIDDAYNANPASLGASLEVLAAAQGTGRKVAYLGDMKELGVTEVALHAGIAHLPAMEGIDVVHCVGPLMRHLHAALPEAKRGRCCDTADEMAKGVAADLRVGDIVLAKGSLSMGLARVVDAIRKMGEGPAPSDQDGN